MKRILMLMPENCGAGDTKKDKIYEIIKDELVVYNSNVCDGVEEWEDTKEYEYTAENLEKYKDCKKVRWITIKDESSEDCFDVFDDENRFIIYENDRELAHSLIDRVEGLDKAIVNLATSLILR